MRFSIAAVIFSVSLAMPVMVQAAQTVVTFDDVPGFNLVDGYGGISGWELVGHLYSFGETPSFRGLGGELSFDNAPVVFHGTDYVAWGESPFSYSLFYQDQLLYSAPLDALNQPGGGSDPYWLPSGYTGLVDKIQFYSVGGDGFVVDNLTYSVAAVPEPEVYALYLAGLSLVGFVAYRRRALSAS